MGDQTWIELTRSYLSWNDKEIRGFFGFGENEYGFLSNFYLTDVYFDGVLYPSSEHAYMASKTNILHERKPLVKVCDINGKHIGLNSADAKKYGRNVTLREDWEVVKLDMMLAVVFDKFWRNPELRKRLVKTGDRYLEETNHWNDTFYGVDYKTGLGQNQLGKILMKVRAILS